MATSSRLTTADLAAIAKRHAGAPLGPYVAHKTLQCHQLLANVNVDPRGKLKVNGHGPVVYSVLEMEGGRAFCCQAHDDVSRLLAHVEAIEVDKLELELRLKQRGG